MSRDLPAITVLDLAGLKCPLPVLRTRKALATLPPGARLEVRCTDPMSVIDIPNLVRETGGTVEAKRENETIVFSIEKSPKPGNKSPDQL